MNEAEKERLIKKDIAMIENKVRHAFNQGYEMGLKESKSEIPTSCGDAISRQAAIDALGEAPKVWTDSPEEFAALSQWEMDVTAIKALPSAEAVEVIRCGECIHWDESAGMGDHRWCRLLKVSMTATDYCSHGEGGKHE